MSEWEERFRSSIDRANSLYKEERDDEAWALYTEVISQEKKVKDDADLFQILRCRINRGILAWRTDRESKAREDWLKASETPANRGEWLDRVKIRALRNLAFLEDLPPFKSPWIRRCLADYSDSAFPSVHDILFDAVIGAPWPFEGDPGPWHLLQTFLGNKGDFGHLARVWRSLQRTERDHCRGWWGQKASFWEQGIAKELAPAGSGYSDEAWYQPPLQPVVSSTLRHRESGKGGIRALLLGHGGAIGWLGADGEAEFPPQPPLPGNAVRLFAWDAKNEKLALVREGRGNRMEIIRGNEREWIQPLHKPLALAWGPELGWVDDKGCFQGKVKVSKGPLKGIAAWEDAFLVWDAQNSWIVKPGTGKAEPFPHKQPIGRTVRAGKLILVVSGTAVTGYGSDGTARESWQLPWSPTAADADGSGFSVWTDGREVLMVKNGKEVRRAAVPDIQTVCVGRGFVAAGCVDWSVRLVGSSAEKDKILRFHRDWVVDLAWDDRSGILYSAGLDGGAAAWNPETGELVGAWGQLGGLGLAPLAGDWLTWGLSWIQADAGEFPLGAGDPLSGVVASGTDWQAATLGGRLIRKGQWVPFPASPPYLGLLEKQGEPLLAVTGALWRIKTSKSWELWDKQTGVSCSADLPENRWAVGTTGGTVALWDGQEWRVSEAWHEGAVQKIFYIGELLSGPDSQAAGSLVSVGEDGKIYLWDASTLLAVEVMKNDRKALLGAVACKRSLVGWDGSNNLRVWNLPGRGGYWEVPAHKGGVSCAIADNEGRYLISAGKEGEVRLWQLPGVEPVGKLVHIPEPVSALSLRPDGLLGILGKSGTVSELKWDGKEN